MKHVIRVTLLAIVLCFVACGKQDGQSTGPKGENTTAKVQVHVGQDSVSKIVDQICASARENAEAVGQQLTEYHTSLRAAGRRNPSAAADAIFKIITDPEFGSIEFRRLSVKRLVEGLDHHMKLAVLKRADTEGSTELFDIFRSFPGMLWREASSLDGLAELARGESPEMAELAARALGGWVAESPGNWLSNARQTSARMPQKAKEFFAIELFKAVGSFHPIEAGAEREMLQGASIFLGELDEQLQIRLMSDYTATAARHDPKGMLAAAISEADLPGVEAVAVTAFSLWVHQAPDAATTYLNTVPRSEIKDTLIRSMFGSIHGELNLDEKRAWISELSSPELQSEMAGLLALPK